MKPRPRKTRDAPARRARDPGSRRDRDPREGTRPALSNGAVVDLEVTDMAIDGDALGRLGDLVVFAPGSIPGERVRARIRGTTRKLARSEVVAILRRSPHRVAPRCKHFGPCGGCAWQHIAYAEQLRLKTRMLSSLLDAALEGSAPPVLETIGLEGGGDARDPAAPWGFRDKTHFVLGPGKGGRSLSMGHYRRGSRDVVEVEECPVHAADGNRVAFRARDALLRYGVEGTIESESKAPPRGVARHIVVRAAQRTGQTQATIVATRGDSKKLLAATREIAAGSGAPRGLHLNVHDRQGPFIFGRETTRLHGDSRLLDRVAGASFVLSPTSFFQTSVRSAENLVRVVLGFIPADEREPLLDLYAGAGLFSIPLAKRGHRVTAVEESAGAVSDGIASARINDLPPNACRFVRARAETWKEEEDSRFGAVILDPPRDGCPEVVLTRVLRRLRPARVVYVSCNPRALAQDLALARKAGYRIDAVQPVDMFPHTPHIETVALLTRQ